MIQCLQCATPPLTHVEIPRPRDAAELNNDGVIKLGDVYHQTEPILSIFFERDIVNDNSSFCSHIRSAIDLQCHVFPFEKLFVKCPSLSVNGIFDDVRYDVISTQRRCGVIRKIPAKYHDNVPKFVKVIPRILWRFFRTGCLFTTLINANVSYAVFCIRSNHNP